MTETSSKESSLKEISCQQSGMRFQRPHRTTPIKLLMDTSTKIKNRNPLIAAPEGRQECHRSEHQYQFLSTAYVTVLIRHHKKSMARHRRQSTCAEYL